MKRICLHPWFSASLRQGEGEGTRILKRRHCAPSALCSSCMRIPLLGDLPVSCNRWCTTYSPGPGEYKYKMLLQRQIQIQIPASFMQQVMHYIFTCLELAKLDKYKMQSSTNTKCESRQIQNVNLNKYKMQEVMHYMYSPAWSWRSTKNTKCLCIEYPTKCWGDSSVTLSFLLF